MTTTRDIMTKDPLTCREDQSINDAAQLMWERDIGALPVVDRQGRAVGMLTDRDIAMAAYTQGKAPWGMTVRSAMAREVHAARPTTSLGEVMAMMRDHRVRRIPVLDDQRRPVGIVALNDLATRAGPGRKAIVGDADLANTVRAVCERQGASRQEEAAE